MTNKHGCNAQKPHFVLVPLFAQGHMIPMVDLAHLIADRGGLVSFMITPVNAARIKPTIDRIKSADSPIRFVELDFPCAEAGLPEGCENMDLITSLDHSKAFFNATAMLRHPLELYLRQAEPAPSCMIADYCNSFTAEIARSMKIKRIIFHGPSCFYLHCLRSIREHQSCDGAGALDPVVVPDLPRKVEITRVQAPGWFDWPGWEDIRDRAIQAEESADGIVVNTFCELEPDVLARYEKAIQKRVWPIGPLCLYNKDASCKAARGKKASIGEDQILSWLDRREPKTVIYVNFGSLVRTRPSQLIEIGCGLEASKRPFIWVIKEVERCAKVEEWMSEGFEERTKGRGLIVTGWAPQLLILSHPSVGGFLTHCGWNSMLEAISAGVPMITWPFFADQFLNEKLVVEILEIGVAIGVKIPSYMLKEDEVAVKRGEVEKAVVRSLDGGEEGKERRERAAKFGEKARAAMEEGGSSYENLTQFMEYVSKSAMEDPCIAVEA